MAGRPSKLNEETINTIADSVASGMSRQNACRMAGISPATLASWINRYQEGEENQLLEKLVSSLSQARANFEKSMIDNVINCATNKDDWRGFFELLKARERAIWGEEKESKFFIRFLENFGQFLENQSIDPDLRESIKNLLVDFLGSDSKIKIFNHYEEKTEV